MYSATNGWASGSSIPPGIPPAQFAVFYRYDGHTWSALPTAPSPLCPFIPAAPPAQVADGEIWQISCANYSSTNNPGAYSILHFDGHRWSAQPFPSPGTDARLVAISMVSPQEGWILGYATTASGAYGNFLLQYSQGKWQLVPSQQPLGRLPVQGRVQFVDWFTMVSPNDGWLQMMLWVADGPNVTAMETVFLHYVDDAWSKVTLSQSVEGMNILPSGEAWAYGGISRELFRTVPPNGSELDNIVVPLLLHYFHGVWNVVLD